MTITSDGLYMTTSSSAAGGALASFVPDEDFTNVAEASVNAVVHVKTLYAAQVRSYSDPFLDFFFGQGMQQPRQQVQMASGSGVIISQDGYIVTNNHVIERAQRIMVVLNDKREFEARLVGTDPNTDIALLKVEAEGLPTIAFGDADALKIGEWVLAIGNPFNLTSTVTAGIVSAKARSINIINTDMRIESFIQTDAAVNPGNSGGALVNTRGELVGINTAIASQTGSYAGYAFAVPSDIVQKVVADIQQYGRVQRAMLGVQTMDITPELQQEAGLNTLQGAYVAYVVKGSAAQQAGIRTGDVILQIDGAKIQSANDLRVAIGKTRPGDKIAVVILRNGERITLQVELVSTTHYAS
ncbi:MAG: Do family serine endopeptidase [Paludibacteraceae bacterium]|nr:Do family serine endopeptidase [Paludibacteraceae bacterium]